MDGAWWMLREAELARLEVGHIVLDQEAAGCGTVTLLTGRRRTGPGTGNRQDKDADQQHVNHRHRESSPHGRLPCELSFSMLSRGD